MRTCANPDLEPAPLEVGAMRGDNRIEVLCVETNTFLRKERNLVVFDASVVASCKNRLFTKLAPVGSLLLASLHFVLLQRSYKSQGHLIIPGFKQTLSPKAWSL